VKSAPACAAGDECIVEVTVDRFDAADGIRAWWSAMPSISRRAAPVA
jgi:hypothetical protein